MAARGSPCLGRQPALWAAARGLPSGPRARRARPGRVAAERQQRLCSQRAGHRFRTKTRAARVGNEARGAYDRTERQAQKRASGISLAVREGSSPAMRAVMPVAGRVSANARTRGMPCGAGLDIMGNQYASVAKSTTIHAPQLKQWEAAPSSQTTDDPEVKRVGRRAGRTNAGPNVRTFEKGLCGWHSLTNLGKV